MTFSQLLRLKQLGADACTSELAACALWFGMPRNAHRSVNSSLLLAPMFANILLRKGCSCSGSQSVRLRLRLQPTTQLFMREPRPNHVTTYAASRPPCVSARQHMHGCYPPPLTVTPHPPTPYLPRIPGTKRPTTQLGSTCCPKLALVAKRQCAIEADPRLM